MDDESRIFDEVIYQISIKFNFKIHLFFWWTITIMINICISNNSFGYIYAQLIMI
jgi:hypothetical protein